jgi:ABC-2 type transport system ATP-binding protein/lipopolysaccharide transport system ATP-binding protein
MNSPIAFKDAPARTLDAGTAMVLDKVSVRYRVPRERVSGLKEYAIRWLQRRIQYESFWALNDVSFDVKRGEVFGVIGRNGTGKSTLLKVMARVLAPTRGRIITRGRVAPLLELGAGFHHELTGRENIYLNCALLGSTQHQTEELLPGIIDFAEIADFIDAPLRTYSTGMIARLGFAVATAVRPDILLVDEVLSVGDTAFQEKCLQRMNGFLNKGTTIIIVSHSLPTIHSFCHRAVWLDHGLVKAVGTPDEAIQAYAKTF